MAAVTAAFIIHVVQDWYNWPAGPRGPLSPSSPLVPDTPGLPLSPALKTVSKKVSPKLTKVNVLIPILSTQ